MKMISTSNVDLRNIPKTKKKKRILLINPKRNGVLFTMPHNGLATLAAIIKKRGHEVLIVDYAFLFEDQDKDISFFMEKFKPDVVGVSIYTTNAPEAEKIISRVNEISPNLPLLVGGPHASLYFDLLEKNKKIDYIFKGEAELTIIKIIENAKKQKHPQIVQSSSLVDISLLPFPDYKSFYKWELMTNYPIMTSRGCPFQCSFCASANLAYRKWRARKSDECLVELRQAQKEISPNLKFVVFDDNPITDKQRFKEFLKMYSREIKAELTVVNVRADGVDDEFLDLLKKCHVQFISVGVEHANPEVFKLINKGETLGQIEKACLLIKKHKISLGMSFVIGSPKDSLEKTKDSIRFARKFKADECSINLICPYRYTAARKWFEENQATLYNEVGYDVAPLGSLRCESPVVETPEFTKKEREKAYYMFLLGVADERFKLSKLPEIFQIAKEYDMYSDFFFWLPRGILMELKQMRKFAKRAVSIYKNYGFNYLVKRYIIFKKQTK